MARVIIVFSDKQIIAPLNLIDDTTADNEKEELVKALKHDFIKISEMSGRVHFSAPAAALVQKWYDGAGNYPPAHPRLIHYCTRRTLQLVKLCTIAAVDRGSLLITEQDFSSALSWLVEAEGAMTDVFKAMSHGGDSVVVDDCLHWLRVEYIKTGKPIPKFKVKHFLRQRIPVHSIDRAFQVMIDTHMIKEDMLGCTPVDGDLSPLA